VTRLVSVLLPVFNSRATLAQALESIRRQRGVELECVAVDDGSSDGSLACLEQAAASDARIRVFSMPHRGIVEALNHGLAHCRGELVARMDADDIMHRQRLASQVAWLESHPELAGVGCHVRLFPRLSPRLSPGLGASEGRAVEGRREYERWLNSLADAADVSRDQFIECPLAHPSWLLRRELFQRFAYRDMGWPEDYDLLLRLLSSGHALGVVPRRLLSWRDSPGRLSRCSVLYSDERFTRAKAHFLAGSWLARHSSYVLWGYGSTGGALCRALLEHGKQPRAIIEVHPGRIGQRIQGAPVVTPDALLDARRGPTGDLPIIVSVARAAARNQVRVALHALGLRELRDFICAA
jgi:glycosyltransferase involved in cell wall biosynthesis